MAIKALWEAIIIVGNDLYGYVSMFDFLDFFPRFSPTLKFTIFSINSIGNDPSIGN